ncbi:MAG: methyltransferase domain-containing protein [Sedimentisphaerales bacterium]|nr:methyltransferase domain-containing protein [Sedimentisphaerales bacterium]
MLKKCISKIPDKWLSLWFRFFYFGCRFYCPCCGGHFRKLFTYGRRHRENAQCPYCRSLERHRFLWYFLKNSTDFFVVHYKFLHFAPEQYLQNKFRNMPNLKYISADLKSDIAMVKTDITNLSFENNDFDAILCSHVLEHVPDDYSAINELYRVLRPNGWAIVQVPVDDELNETFEDPDIKNPEERERLFGQYDHVRYYGLDIKERLSKAGFAVEVFSAEDLLPEIVRKQSLVPIGEKQYIFFCKKTKD